MCYKRSVLRRQISANIKIQNVRVLPIGIIKSNISSVGPSREQLFLVRPFKIRTISSYEVINQYLRRVAIGTIKIQRPAATG